MYQCDQCNKEEVFYKTQFDVVGKTFFSDRITKKLLCFRHWHQLGRPDYKYIGDYENISKLLKATDKNVTSITSCDF
jgi:hypothetical protein